MANPTPPPSCYRFKPGQSGNPAGRPKGRSVMGRLNEFLRQPVRGRGSETWGARIANLIIEGAAKGDRRCLAILHRECPAMAANGHNGRRAECSGSPEPHLATPAPAGPA